MLKDKQDCSYNCGLYERPLKTWSDFSSTQYCRIGYKRQLFWPIWGVGYCTMYLFLNYIPDRFWQFLNQGTALKKNCAVKCLYIYIIIICYIKYKVQSAIKLTGFTSARYDQNLNFPDLRIF